MAKKLAARRRCAEHHVNAADTALARQDCSAALRHFREALVLSRRLMIAEPANEQHVYRAARCELGIGRVLEIQGYPEKGAAHLTASVELLEPHQGAARAGCPAQPGLPVPLAVPVPPGADRTATWRVFELSESGTDMAIELAERLTRIADGLEAHSLARGGPLEAVSNRERLQLAGTARRAALEQAFSALDTLCALINVFRPFPDSALLTRWQGQEAARARKRRRLLRQLRATRTPS